MRLDQSLQKDCIRGSSPTSLSQQNHCIKPLPTRATLVTEETEKAMTAAL
ncbi:hypothetical protein SCLCIDRAFT_34659 [Scleroderma citrinum Foug A]|uniref:Uncharacterized protein n=1 Tax=Scleroderma citrinum Foug A TaxID=1036808 RepID=A0A0C3D1Z5_9AGAM|nr:hypothetical protein SCLCIDRAFT_34659 [Scleroderma citrinum Foug A]